ncbi:MAG: sugar phosphate isomerase/epimerase [Saprospiraceae bacterium]|nr:sugar phosphate isomerase/epimerase [Saprospiraceae bacterium]
MHRRRMIAGLGLATAGAMLPDLATAADVRHLRKTPAFTYCLNASTIRGQELGIVNELEIASEAGYDSMEIWVPGLQKYLDEGGKIDDLRKRIRDLGLTIEDAIGFAQWIVDDPNVRAAAIEQLKVEMDLLRRVGCKRIAAPPAGATKVPGLDLDAVAGRYYTVVELGEQMGVMPQLEVWGFSANLHKISQVMYVLAECGHPKARVLPDVYHLFKGGSDFDALKMIDPHMIEIFHMNDYPASPNREDMDDSYRVYTGDGIGPVEEVLRDLYAEGQTTVLSLELFNRDYWAQDPLEVAKTGLKKMKACVKKMMW